MVMLNGKTYAPSSYVGSPRFTRMEKTARTTFSNGEKYPTTKEVRLLLALRLVSVVVTDYRSSIRPCSGRKTRRRTLGTSSRSDCRWTISSLNDTALYHLINVGVRDMDAIDKPWDASTRSMRYTACLGDRLWTMITREQNRVCVFYFFVLLRN